MNMDELFWKQTSKVNALVKAVATIRSELKFMGDVLIELEKELNEITNDKTDEHPS